MENFKIGPEGTPCWLEIPARGPIDDLKKFYSSLFPSWTFFDAKDGAPIAYFHDTVGVYGGIVGVPGDLKPSPQDLGLGMTVNWVVSDLDAAAAKVAELGGSKALDKMPAGEMGSFMQFRDPHGNRFALFQKA